MGGSYYPIPSSILSTGKDRKTPQRYPHVPTTSWRIFIRSMDSFQGLTPKSPSSWHRPLAPIPDFYDYVNPVTRRTIDQSTGGKLRDHNAEESWALLLALIILSQTRMLSVLQSQTSLREAKPDPFRSPYASLTAKGYKYPFTTLGEGCWFSLLYVLRFVVAFCLGNIAFCEDCVLSRKLRFVKTIAVCDIAFCLRTKSWVLCFTPRINVAVCLKVIVDCVLS
ncbi:hypothetical protein Tco_1534246 [Tanacetum coccineum]